MFCVCLHQHCSYITYDYVIESSWALSVATMATNFTSRHSFTICRSSVPSIDEINKTVHPIYSIVIEMVSASLDLSWATGCVVFIVTMTHSCQCRLNLRFVRCLSRNVRRVITPFCWKSLSIRIAYGGNIPFTSAISARFLPELQSCKIIKPRKERSSVLQKLC